MECPYAITLYQSSHFATPSAITNLFVIDPVVQILCTQGILKSAEIMCGEKWECTVHGLPNNLQCFIIKQVVTCTPRHSYSFLFYLGIIKSEYDKWSRGKLYPIMPYLQGKDIKLYQDIDHAGIVAY